MLARADQVADSIDPIRELIAEGQHREAVARCAAEHGASIGRLCMVLLGSQEDAEEATQETLLAAHRAMASYRGDGSVRAWLFGIARRQCAKRLARGQKRQLLQLVAEPAGDEDPARDAAVARRAHRVRGALAVLKPSEREALILRYAADLSYREIGDICGIDEAAARKRASRGLQRLRGALSPEEVE